MNNSARFVPSRVWLKVLVGPALSGWLFAMAFAPVAFRPFTFFALMLLMLSLKGLSTAEARRAAFIFGAVAYGIGLSWFWNLFGWLSLALIGLLSLYVMVGLRVVPSGGAAAGVASSAEGDRHRVPVDGH